MKQAVITQTLPLRKRLGARVKAMCLGESVTLPWNFNQSAEFNHKKAAMALLIKIYKWDVGYEIVTGQIGNRYVHIQSKKPI